MKYKLKTIDGKHITLNDDYVVYVQYLGHHNNVAPHHSFLVATSPNISDTKFDIPLFDDYKMNDDDSNYKFVCDWGFNKE